MKAINKGDTIFIPVEVSNGPFIGECLINFQTLEGSVSGFISESQVIRRDSIRLIEAKVLDVDSDRISIRLHGSFFTTTGLAHISHEAFERAA